MRTLVVESTPTILRWCFDAEDEQSEVFISNKLVGLKHHDVNRWLWTNGKERLTAFSDERICVHEIWEKLLDPENSYPHDDAVLLTKCVSASVSKDSIIDRLVFLIPECTPETSQNALISELSSAFSIAHNEVYLLWRSVAISLSEDPAPNNTHHRIVADFGHLNAEASQLEWVKFKGTVCPMRDFTLMRAKGISYQSAITYWLNNNYSAHLKESDIWNSPLAVSISSNLEQDLNFDPAQAWSGECLNYKPVAVAHADFAQPIPLDDVLINIDEFITEKELCEGDLVMWHGWPVYWHGINPLQRSFAGSKLTEPESAIIGAQNFAKRHRLKEPTFVERLPGYEIWCQSSELGLPKVRQWVDLVPRKIVAGTDTLKPKPIDRFQINKGSKEFPLNIRLTNSDKYRFIEASLPERINEDTPILVNSRVRPTGGSVKISISPKDNPALFGRNSEISLRWDTATERPTSEIEDPITSIDKYAYPFIIQSTGSVEKREELMSVAISFLGGDRGYPLLRRLDNLMVPSLKNKYQVPFGNRPAQKELPEKLQEFIDALNDESHWHIRNVTGADKNSSKFVRIAGALFYYASRETQAYLSEVSIRSDFPLNSANASSVYWANGRVIRDAEQLELYLKKALHEWDHLAGMHYWLFWPFAKSLCQFGDGAKISRQTAYQVFVCASEMLDWISNENVPTAPGAFGKPNWKKWTLAAILYGLRVRELIPDFLSLETGPQKEKNLAAKIQDQLSKPEILLTKIPELALKGIDTGDEDPRLGALVLRFLEARATETDIALAGGIGLSS